MVQVGWDAGRAVMHRFGVDGVVGGGDGSGSGGRGWCPFWSLCLPKMSTIKLIILSKKVIVLKRQNIRKNKIMH